MFAGFLRKVLCSSAESITLITLNFYTSKQEKRAINIRFLVKATLIYICIYTYIYLLYKYNIEQSTVKKKLAVKTH